MCFIKHVIIFYNFHAEKLTVLQAVDFSGIAKVPNL
jgi:hypothetical protein